MEIRYEFKQNKIVYNLKKTLFSDFGFFQINRENRPAITYLMPLSHTASFCNRSAYPAMSLA